MKGRSQCIIIRNNKILMAKHCQDGEEWRCLPGGGIEENETPEQAAIRELQEECNVTGVIIKKTSEYTDPYSDKINYTYLIDIGKQEPKLGYDPEVIGTPILQSIDWLSLYEISELDRAHLWSAGLISIKEFANELDSWSREISYPCKRTK